MDRIMVAAALRTILVFAAGVLFGFLVTISLPSLAASVMRRIAASGLIVRDGSHGVPPTTGTPARR